MSADIATIVKISKALADENRYRIFKLISEKGEIPCKDITAAFPLSQPTISHHLKVLMESGLISFRKEGQWSYFYINQQTLDLYLTFLKDNIQKSS
ncbi:MAG: transcriptional regulator [Methanobacteriota archaeon]|nr:MAG: transcriptional regulator [Euryarchaeota archaeon]